MEGVVSVFPSEKKKLHTTRSWNFMGFPLNVTRSTYESDIIIGMLDSGIWPESESFNDKGFGPPPTKWKGICQGSSNFTCNNKVIGARYYHSEGEVGPGEIASPRDSEGHGTHTASTAAGDVVSHASLLGVASGTARGGLPSARIAVYKICWSDGCSDADILAAFDDAIADGVDVISLSVGGWPLDYFQDSIAIGAFHSMKNGILTSNSAGNSGPRSESVLNFSPWALSVAASTIDRKFVSQVKLGNGAIYEGLSINTFDLGNTMYPIIYGGEAPNQTAGYEGISSRLCTSGSLNKTLVEGKIVLCDAATIGSGAIAAGAVGSIMQNGFFKDLASSYILPASVLRMSDGADILQYLNSASEPTATILKSIDYKDEYAPYVVSFSSRGPSPITDDILKPDLTAPGVDILAAWSKATTVTGSKWDKRVVPYNIISGTSMSCPHASGAAAYVKSFHPTWSPAALKSALMTTAYPMTTAANSDAEFAYGSGHINPVKAIDPGLVYDAEEIDYVKFLCGQGYNATQLQLVTGDNSTCSEETNGTVWDLNYPSFALSTLSGQSVTRIFHRTVTNVGSSSSTYKAIVNPTEGLNIQVQPNVISFQSLGEKQSFVVTVEAALNTTAISGSLTWDNGVHQLNDGTNVLDYLNSTSGASDFLLHSYHRSFNGFVAKLTEDEKQKLAGMEGVVSVFPSKMKKLHTTRSWTFMGFPQNVTRSTQESDIIIGMLDTGIWPESESFNDEGFGPPPAKWKGTCQNSSNFTCNNKIIGARYYYAEGQLPPGNFASPRDSEGHGSHTSSTAAGNIVSEASLLGLGSGTARGGVPSARIAVYKICWSNGCWDADILAAFDDAIADGVDIISLSVGGWPMDYFEDSIAIGAFHSMKNGILTSNSAGNDGPEPGSISNCSPWSLSVAASTIDRKFVTQVKLGNEAAYQGLSINTFTPQNSEYPIIYGGDAPNVTSEHNGTYSRYCTLGSLNKTLVQGKIVLCDSLNFGSGPIAAGAVGSVMEQGFYTDVAFAFPLPVSPPDLTAPGVDILAAWSEATTVTGSEWDHRVVPYNIISGTSMSCPHASGAAAYVKSFHPTWSPAAIKSALMTTAYSMSATTNIDAEFAYGSGHINPVNATDPGLVYDAEEIDYVKFLCGQGYNATQLKLVTGDNSSCSEETNGTVWDLNYPSFALSTLSGQSVSRIFHRTVTNVGSAPSTYKAIVEAPSVLDIQVQPNVLSFKSLGEKQSFVVIVEAVLNNSAISGSLTWDDGVHQVRSPILAHVIHPSQ
ncbi:hypothetical protein GH714_012024 [Hevea brasiliensis]|uniref:Cucumisin n=1 Tax=Hevea brasiliensis TaxID=3981 RepID=A0A6A6N2T5_HEVBR|nr:hypothetical protein GH714_012024 [Hevea brasiliensis]